MTQIQPNEMLRRAAALLEERRYREAADALGPLIDDPTIGTVATYLLGCAQLSLDDPFASESFSTVLERGGEQQANSAYFLGELATRDGRAALAACFYSGALAFDPHHEGAQRRLHELGIQRPGAASAAPPAAPPGRSHVAPPDQPPAVPAEPPAELKRPPRAPRRNDSRIGIVLDARPQTVPTRAGPATAQRLDVDIQEFDRQGRQLHQSYAFLLGVKISGSATRGQWVELIDEPSADGRVRRLLNLSNGSEVRSKSSILFPGS